MRTAVHVNPEDPDWETTAAGRPYSYKYGYGALNGVDFVNAALEWQSVKPQAWIDLPTIQIANGTMDLFRSHTGGEPIVREGLTSKMEITQDLLQQHNFEKLEHITVKVWIVHTRRGDVEVELVSPKGVKSILAASRWGDSANTGYPGWTFSTVKHWYARNAPNFNDLNSPSPVGTRTLLASGPFVFPTKARTISPAIFWAGR